MKNVLDITSVKDSIRLFDAYFEGAEVIQFEDAWKNETGYLNHAVKVSLPPGERRRFIDDYGRRGLLFGVGHRSFVVFERYKSGFERDRVMVSNRPVPFILDEQADDLYCGIFSSNLLEPICQGPEKGNIPFTVMMFRYCHWVDQIRGQVERFYPIDAELKRQRIDTLVSWRTHLLRLYKEAQGGDSDSESELCNRIGSLRISFPEGIPEWARETLDKIVPWLKSTGRKFDFTSPDPRQWITRRSGSPRW